MVDEKGDPETGSKQAGTPTEKLDLNNKNVGIAPEISPTMLKPERRHLINYDEILLSSDGLLPMERISSTIPVRKPNKDEFFRTRTDPGWEGNLPIFIHRGASGGDETFLVMPEVQMYLQEQKLLRRVRMFTLITQGGVLLLMPIPLPELDGTTNSYNDGKLVAVTEGMRRWVRMVANNGTKGYDLHYTESTLPEPVWPALPATFHDALDIAFKGKIIENMDHKHIMALRGVV